MSDLTPEEIQKLCIVAEALEQENARLQARVRELEAAARPLVDHLWTSSARLPTGETIRLLRALGDVLDSKPLAAVSAEKEDDDE